MKIPTDNEMFVKQDKDNRLKWKRSVDPRRAPRRNYNVNVSMPQFSTKLIHAARMHDVMSSVCPIESLNKFKLEKENQCKKLNRRSNEFKKFLLNAMIDGKVTMRKEKNRLAESALAELKNMANTQTLHKINQIIEYWKRKTTYGAKTPK